MLLQLSCALLRQLALARAPPLCAPRVRLARVLRLRLAAQRLLARGGLGANVVGPQLPEGRLDVRQVRVNERVNLRLDGLVGVGAVDGALNQRRRLAALARQQRRVALNLGLGEAGEQRGESGLGLLCPPSPCPFQQKKDIRFPGAGDNWKCRK
jgi:anti-sigma factor RsiW